MGPGAFRFLGGLPADGAAAWRSPLLPPSQRRTPRPSRTGRNSRRRRWTTSRPDTRTLWWAWGVRGGAGSWVPICLGAHVWVSPLVSRLGCPVSSGLKMKAPARSVAAQMVTRPFSHTSHRLFFGTKSTISFINQHHIRQVQTLNRRNHLVLVLYSVQQIVLSTIPVQWL